MLLVKCLLPLKQCAWWTYICACILNWVAFIYTHTHTRVHKQYCLSFRLCTCMCKFLIVPSIDHRYVGAIFAFSLCFKIIIIKIIIIITSLDRYDFFIGKLQKFHIDKHCLLRDNPKASCISWKMSHWRAKYWYK